MEWIDINQKTPPHRTNVLAVFKLTGYQGIQEPIIKICFYDYEGGFNLENQDNLQDKIARKCFHVVTHWMSLPDLPKE